MGSPAGAARTILVYARTGGKRSICCWFLPHDDDDGEWTEPILCRPSQERSKVRVADVQSARRDTLTSPCESSKRSAPPKEDVVGGDGVVEFDSNPYRSDSDPPGDVTMLGIDCSRSIEGQKHGVEQDVAKELIQNKTELCIPGHQYRFHGQQAEGVRNTVDIRAVERLRGVPEEPEGQRARIAVDSVQTLELRRKIKEHGFAFLAEGWPRPADAELTAGILGVCHLVVLARTHGEHYKAEMENSPSEVPESVPHV